MIRAGSMGVVALLVGLGCGRGEDLGVGTRSIWYADPTKQSQLASELDKAGIPYDVIVEGGREYIRVTAAHSARTSDIEERLFGPDLPTGRNLGLEPPERQEKFKQWLRDNRIPFKEVTRAEGNYIVWDAADDKKVRTWQDFPSHYDNPPTPAAQTR